MGTGQRLSKHNWYHSILINKFLFQTILQCAVVLLRAILVNVSTTKPSMFMSVSVQLVCLVISVMSVSISNLKIFEIYLLLFFCCNFVFYIFSFFLSLPCLKCMFMRKRCLPDSHERTLLFLQTLMSVRMDSMIVTLLRKQYATIHLVRMFVIVVMVTAEKMENYAKVKTKFYKISCSDVISCNQQTVLSYKSLLLTWYN